MAKGSAKLSEALAKVDELGAKASVAVLLQRGRGAAAHRRGD